MNAELVMNIMIDWQLSLFGTFIIAVSNAKKYNCAYDLYE